MAWQDYIYVPGVPTSSTAMLIQGIGATNYQSVMDADAAIETYLGDVSGWLVDREADIEGILADYAVNETIEYPEIPAFPTIAGLPAIIVGLPPAIRLAIQVSLVLVGHIIEAIVKRKIDDTVRRRLPDGQIDPFLKLFQKFAFLKDNDVNQGFADLVSILLLLADRPIEIYNSMGQRDVFLDNTVKQGV
jgi:hypothetical protein